MYMVYTYGTAQQPLLLEGLHVTNQPAAKTAEVTSNHWMNMRFLFNVFQFLTKNL